MADTMLGVLAYGDQEMLTRPCVDCGLLTGRFCDWCFAADRLPNEEWADGQMTPLCSDCDNMNSSKDEAAAVADGTVSESSEQDAAQDMITDKQVPLPPGYKHVLTCCQQRAGSKPMTGP